MNFITYPQMSIFLHVEGYELFVRGYVTREACETGKEKNVED